MFGLPIVVQSLEVRAKMPWVVDIDSKDGNSTRGDYALMGDTKFCVLWYLRRNVMGIL